MSDKVLKYAKTHVAQLVTCVVAILTAVTVVAKDHQDLKDTLAASAKHAAAIRNLENEDYSQLVILKRIEVNQKWIMERLKETRRHEQ